MRYGTLFILAFLGFLFTAPSAKAECMDIGTCVATQCPSTLTCFTSCEQALNSCLTNQAASIGATGVSTGATEVSSPPPQSEIQQEAEAIQSDSNPNYPYFDYADYYRYGPGYQNVTQEQEVVDTTKAEVQAQVQAQLQAEESQLLMNWVNGFLP